MEVSGNNYVTFWIKGTLLPPSIDNMRNLISDPENLVTYYGRETREWTILQGDQGCKLLICEMKQKGNLHQSMLGKGATCVIGHGHDVLRFHGVCLWIPGNR